MAPSTTFFAAVVAMTGAIATCSSDPLRPVQVSDDLAFRVYRNPYAGVDWTTDRRLTTQLHDHIAESAGHLRAYDRAGYHVVALVDYSGAPSLSHARQERLWPPEAYFAADVLEGLESIELILPGAEEVGFDHLTSPFLRTYIERARVFRDREIWRHSYRDTQEAIDLIRGLGGLAIIAHPWGNQSEYRRLARFDGVEIYSAYAEVRRREGNRRDVRGRSDPNRAMLRTWDDVLTRDQTVLGVAVNDHYGPGTELLADGDPLKDSGKVIVLARSASEADVRDAFDRGAIVAVRDIGAVKNRYPTLREIRLEGDMISIVTNATVRWIGDGVMVAEGSSIAVSGLRTSYVRAELSEGDSDAVTYTQAFMLRPVGDVDGDWYVDERDDSLCQAVISGGVRPPLQVDACAARGSQVASRPAG